MEMRNRQVTATILIAFAGLLVITLLPTATERGIMGVVGFLVGVGLAWRQTRAEVRPMMVVGVFVAGAVSAIVMPLVMNDTLPKLFRGDFGGATVSLIAPLLIWGAASTIRRETSG